MHLRCTRKSPRPWRPAGPVGCGHGEKGRSSLRIMSRSPRGRPWSPAGQPNTEDTSRGDATEGPGARAAGSPGPQRGPGCDPGASQPRAAAWPWAPHLTSPGGAATQQGAPSDTCGRGQPGVPRGPAAGVSEHAVPRPQAPRPPGHLRPRQGRASSGRLQGQVSPSFSGQFGPWPLAFESGCPAFLMEEPLLLQFREVSNFLASFNQV